MDRFLLCLVCTVMTLACWTRGHAQFHLIKKGDEHYRKFEYIDAQQTYLEAVEKGAQSPKIYEKLGNSFYYNSQYEQASTWYQKLIETYPNDINPEYYYRYVQTLKSLGQYERADRYMELFGALRPLDKRVQIYKRHVDYLQEIDSLSDRYQISYLPINTEYSEFGPSYYGDTIVFGSTRGFDKKRTGIHQWNKESYLDLFKVQYNYEKGTLGEVQKWDGNLNSKFHDSSPVFTSDGKTVYFTRNNEEGGTYEQVRTYKLRTDKLKLYRSRIDSVGVWGKPEELPFNSDDYSVAHPALNPEENLLYFVSDMPGGYGDSDLYVVDVHSDGTFNEPKNMGAEINTEGKETFPFVSKSNILYFASDARGGLGGLDIYVRQSTNEDPTSYVIQNMGRPINSPSDDFALIIDDTTKRGFFSSNRPGGKGKDDIYGFIEKIPEPEPEPEPFQPGEDLGIVLNLNPIYFDLDKSFIRRDAAVELNKVVGVLKEHPRIKIEIRSHTDSRATHSYNIKLSERRAKSTREYLILNGIDADRLFSKGFGETQLVNECKDGVYCSEEKHQLNRRSEFVIIEN
ncbi:OmpA family protein [Allomuricauda taeanensis]|uniref:OmpA family protein n=1 Tax=Flagellimonas taeanensis TaxID=1005926 RepID=UPI002E7B3309|nr:OmpA family protein [Allomuricauda taeanensis]MEE1964595.1 OmpA family protein [Allomuricauda taeanensis]